MLIPRVGGDHEGVAVERFSTDVQYARELDARDPLARFRDEFVIADPNLVYFDGNSLGRLPKRGEAKVLEVIGQGAGRLIRGWNEGWFEASQQTGDKIAKLIGAEPGEVIVCDSTSVNVFKLAMAALELQGERRKIVTDNLNFPSDLYLLQGVLGQAQYTHGLEVVESDDGMSIGSDRLGQAIDQETALVALSHTAFKSGWVYDMAEVTAMAHEKGALMLWDLCHSVGAMPLALNEAGVDLAVGCTYKYLNAGPGATAFLYVRRDLQAQLVSPIWGWFGQKDQFDFGQTYEPAPDIRRFQAGTPNIISLALVEAGVDLVLEAGMGEIRDKSVRQTEYLIGLWESWLEPLGVTLNSPRDANRRGSHVSLGHPEGWRINRALIEEMDVIPDFRAPDNLRLGIAPLYTTYEDIHEGMTRLRRVVEEKLYEKYSVERAAVT